MRLDREETLRRDLEERQLEAEAAAKVDESEKIESEEALAAVATRARENWPYRGVARCGQWGSRMWRASLELPPAIAAASTDGRGVAAEAGSVAVGEFFSAKAAALAHDKAAALTYGKVGQTVPSSMLNFASSAAVESAAAWDDVAGSDLNDESLSAWADDAGVPLLVALGAGTLTSEQLRDLR